MSAQFDTAPTAKDIEDARAKLAAIEQHHQGVMAMYVRESAATLVAIELGVIAAKLHASNDLDAEFAAQARALYVAWLEA
jgi:hypothetical protein